MMYGIPIVTMFLAYATGHNPATGVAVGFGIWVALLIGYAAVWPVVVGLARAVVRVAPLVWQYVLVPALGVMFYTLARIRRELRVTVEDTPPS